MSNAKNLPTPSRIPSNSPNGVAQTTKQKVAGVSPDAGRMNESPPRDRRHALRRMDGPIDFPFRNLMNGAVVLSERRLLVTRRSVPEHHETEKAFERWHATVAASLIAVFMAAYLFNLARVPTKPASAFKPNIQQAQYQWKGFHRASTLDSPR